MKTGRIGYQTNVKLTRNEIQVWLEVFNSLLSFK